MAPKMMKRVARRLLPAPVLEYRKGVAERKRRSAAEAHLRRQAASVSLSQAGQDLWVYGECFNETRAGYFVDVGAHNGVHLSNSFLLEKRYGWDGICVEANPDSFDRLRQVRSCRCVNLCVDEKVGRVAFRKDGVIGGIASEDDRRSNADQIVEVDAKPLADILEEANAPATIDYLSIDIEGAEDRALLTFPFDRYRFNCVTIERPSDRLRATFRENGYQLMREIIDLDCCYIHESFRARYRHNLFEFGKKQFVVEEWLSAAGEPSPPADG